MSRDNNLPMPKFKILYDEPQEAKWFRSLSNALADADETSITEAQHWPRVRPVLTYDRPDIVLLDGEKPILVVEETVEVPSGHNVGQRFARIVASAEAGVPFLYFGPYVARKHGGITAGPRYMNVRLFLALDSVRRITGTSITTINWPVDVRSEVRRDQAKDTDVRDYISTFLSVYARSVDLKQLNLFLLSSDIHHRMLSERAEFVRVSVRKPEQYDGPPPSVKIVSQGRFKEIHSYSGNRLREFSDIVVYKIGMNYIRSDPYTGMSMLYRYLYVLESPRRALVLWFPNITRATWREARSNLNRKDVRLFRVAADAILFSDGLVSREDL